MADALRLISEGADREGAGAENALTALLWSSYRAELDGVAARLVAAGARLDRVNASGNSALIFACSYGRAATAQMLVGAGCALDIVNNNNNSALDHVNKAGFEGVSCCSH